MASGYIYGTTGNQYIDARIYWKSTTNPSENTSTLEAQLHLRRNNTGYTTYGTGTFYISIGGPKKVVSRYVTIGTDWVKAAENTTTVYHNDDGTKSVSISASGSIPGTSLDSISVSGYAELDEIPRASVIASASTVVLGQSCSIGWIPRDTSFRYKIKFEAGDWQDETDVIHPGRTSAYTYKGYTMPLEIAKQFPNDIKGPVTATLYTYSDSSCTKQIGEPSSKVFVVGIPNSPSTQPTATMTLSPISSLGSPFNTMYIQGRTKVDANFSNGEGQYGATIASYALVVEGKTYGSPYTSGFLSSTGDVTVKGIVTDSRGFAREYTKTITVIPYQKPQILPASGENAIICARCDKDGTLSDSGTYLKIKVGRNYSKITTSDGVQNNFCTIRIRHREESNEDFYEWKTILDGTTLDSDTADTGPIANVVTSSETAYVVQIGVVDSIGESKAIQFIIPTDFTTIDIPEDYKGRRVGVFRYAQDTEEDGIYFGLPIFGGSVDSLKHGTKLAATSELPIDLNDVKNPGCYYSPGAEYSQYIVNSPYTTGGFGLEVRELQSADYIRQTLYYGRTTFVRHWNTTEWSGWVRYLMTSEAESSATDFVVEQAQTDTWYYRKWHSGMAECWYRRNVDVNINIAWGSALYYGMASTINYPFTFIEKPICQITCEYGNDQASLFIASCGSGTNVYATPVMLCRTDAKTVNCNILYHVHGRWR